MKIFWGDLHNHCAVSYGQGTPALALDNARRQLDFCTITGHAFWPDMPMDLAAQNADERVSPLVEIYSNGASFDVPLRRLAIGSCARLVAGFGSGAVKLHRAIPEREFATSLELPAYAPPAAPGFAYLRIRQTDGRTAWLSPIWFEC